MPVLFAIPGECGSDRPRYGLADEIMAATCLSTIASSMAVKSLLGPHHLRSSDASSDDGAKDASTIALTTQIPFPTASVELPP
ncbi:hypothetical protein PAXINDRAFT_12360 [Paxillus involutus ATCC 200175]|uniref:Uncharacterized protein n=1 Tax=Paxillus involutus ATCC 200175 TaxID=664439 RepID=A0A0C9TWZ2_PAXIN|nr:hypothetical protein PAXINDRAFT_12360 [Paxillus involutus ATCC 200175]